MSEGATIVLGWDGLDYRLAAEFGVANEFGTHHREIGTFDNPELGEPHTHELWPSIITGTTPDDHGIWSATPDGGADWDNQIIAAASAYSQSIVPERVREWVGIHLRNRGAELAHETPAYYDERGIETVFTGRRSRSIAIPNHQTETDTKLGLVTDRGADLAAFLEVEERNGKTVHSPQVPLHTYDERLTAEAGEKLGTVSSAMERDYDIIMVWLGYLDSVGHLQPLVDDTGWQQRAYENAARMTTAIREKMTDMDRLVCVSDHGLRDGNHTHSAFLGSSDRRITDACESVLDVKDAINARTPASGDGEPTIREAFEREGSAVRSRTANDVHEQLEGLGYL